MRRLSFDDLLDLVGSIYDTASSPEGWDPFLERATQLFRGSAAVFFVRDDRAHGCSFGRLWGLPDDALREFQTDFVTRDVGLDTLLELPPRSVVTDESTAPEVYFGSEIYNDFRRRWGAERYVAGDVFRDARRFGVVAVQGRRRRAPFDDAEQRLLGRLLPHLRRAVQMHGVVGQFQSQHCAIEDLLEGAPIGVVLLDEAGEVIHANATARRIDRLRDGLQIVARRLRAASPADDRALGRAITEAIDVARRRSVAGGSALAIGRASHENAFRVLVCPGPGVESRSPFRIAAAMVLVGDPDPALRSPLELTARLYGLTPAEARLARAVASGDSLEAYAEGRGVSIDTARWTLKQVFSKTGARRQADLTRMLLTGPAAFVKSED